MSKILIEPQFFPPIEYFTRLYRADSITLDIHHHYQKQTYRNRCYIRGANKIERLTVPVKAANHTAFKDVTLDYSMEWNKLMWRSIQSAYANAPFYLYYQDHFEKIFLKRHDFLLDMNVEALTLCLKLLNMPRPIDYTKSYMNDPEGGTSDLRSIISPKQKYSSRPFYHPVAYPQLFGSNFDANLSIIDLLFCEGPNAQSIVTKSSLEG